jgi:hypothetical protein
MDSKLTNIFRELEESRADLEAAVKSAPKARLTVPPEPDRWSVAQVLEHLVTSEQRMAGLILRLIGEAKGKAAGAPVAPSGFDPKKVLDRTSKIKTRMGEPEGTVPIGDSFKSLDDQRAQLKAAMTADHGVNLATLSAPHHVFGSMDVYEWLQFMGLHMRRHAAQIRELSE